VSVKLVGSQGPWCGDSLKSGKNHFARNDPFSQILSHIGLQSNSLTLYQCFLTWIWLGYAYSCSLEAVVAVKSNTI